MSIFVVTLLFDGVVARGFSIITGLLSTMAVLIFLGAKAGKFWMGAYRVLDISMAVFSDWVPIQYVQVIPYSNAVLAGMAIIANFALNIVIDRILARHLHHIQNGVDDHVRLVQIDGVGAVFYNDMRAIGGKRLKFGL